MKYDKGPFWPRIAEIQPFKIPILPISAWQGYPYNSEQPKPWITAL